MSDPTHDIARSDAPLQAGDVVERSRKLKTFIIHANQAVVVRSPQNWWPPETLRSRPTFRIEAKTLDEALAKAEADVRKRYGGPNQEVVAVTITAALVREAAE